MPKPKNVLILSIIFFGIFGLTQNSWAKDLFVATTGSDSVAYTSNDISHPWLTPQMAWSSARAGDIVYFRGGTYNITTKIDTNSSGNSGTIDNWITFQSYPGESAIIRAVSAMDCMLQLSKDYQKVQNIIFDCNNTAYRGFGIGWYNSDTSVEGFVADHVTVLNWISGDNACAFYIGSSWASVMASNITITNCTITGVADATNYNQNYSGIMVFGADGFHIENNEITRVRHGIFLKHSSRNYTNTGATVKNNWVHSMHPNGGNGNASINISTNYTTVENNILETYINLGEDGQSGSGSPRGNYNTINHNTLTSSIGFQNEGGSSYNTVTNNIFTARTPAGTGNIWDYNMYAVGAAIGAHDLANKSPIYSGGVSPSTIAGFALTSASFGKGAGSGGTDMGANVSLVGIQSGTPPVICTTGQSQSCVTGELGICSAGRQTCTNNAWSACTRTSSPITEICGNSQDDDCDGSVDEGCSQLGQTCVNWQTLHPEWIFCDDFESTSAMVGTGRYFEYNNNNGDFIPMNGVGLNNSRGMRALWQAGETDAGSLSLGFGRNPSSYMNKGIRQNEDFREVYYRMYLKLQDGWTGNPAKLSRATVIAANDWSQAMIAHLWGNDQQSLLIDPVRCVDGNNVICIGYNDFPHMSWLGAQSAVSPIFNGAYNNQWLCIEAHVKLNDAGFSNGVQEFWMNDQLQARKESLNFVGSYSAYAINAVFFENFWNSGAPKQEERYFDNIVVSTSRIGCDGVSSDTTPPSPPSGLNVN